MIEDLSKTIKAQLYERASSPLLASFGLSWLAWNYRFIVVLLSTMATPEKFQYIDKSLYQSWEAIALRGALCPLMTSLFLIFVYPIPAKYVYEYWRKRQRELKEIQHRIDDETPLTKEEARQLRRDMLKVTSEYEEEIERRSVEVTRLKELVTDLEGRLAGAKKISTQEFPSTSKSENSKLDKGQVELLRSIAAAPRPPAQKTLVSSSGSDRIRSEYNLGELERLGFVTKGYSNPQSDYIFRATHAGRTYLLDEVISKPSDEIFSQESPAKV